MKTQNQKKNQIKTTWSQLKSTGNKLTLEKQQQDAHYSFINATISELQNLLILHKMKTWYNGESMTPPLRFNKDWKIVVSKEFDESSAKGAREVQWDIEKFRINTVKEKLYKLLDNDKEISDEDKVKYKNAIYDFIKNKIAKPRMKLETKTDTNWNTYKTIFYKFRNYYTKFSKEKSSWEEQKLYLEICLTLADILYETNHNFLDQETWEINEKGMEYIANMFSKTLEYVDGNNIPFHKIYHDWDFYFLSLTDFHGNPLIGTLDQYVKAIIYLMEEKKFNAYNDEGEKWSKDWYRTRKLFLNNLFNIANRYMNETEEKKKKVPSNKEAFHEKLADEFMQTSQIKWTLKTHRFKTEKSKNQKHWWRTSEIKDESGLRVTYYWEWDEEKALQSIIDTLKEYFNKLKDIKWAKITNITLAKKGDFVSKEGLEQIRGLLSNFVEKNTQIQLRKRNETHSMIEPVKSKFKDLTWKTMPPGLQQALQLANWEIIRWANGDYKDFKLIVEFEKVNPQNKKTNKEDNSDEKFYQEISFYPETNDVNMWNHRFLELEKRIFERVKYMAWDIEFWASISLNRVRRYTETTIKTIAYDIDKKEEQIAKWIIPKPKDDSYKYLEIDGERLPLKGLIERTPENTKLFDEIIMHIINYFIKKNKLIYINKSKQTFYWLISTEDLHDSINYKYWRRFTTPDALKNLATDWKNSDKNISFYTDQKTVLYKNFRNVQLKELGKMIWLQNEIKKAS